MHGTPNDKRQMQMILNGKRQTKTKQAQMDFIIYGLNFIIGLGNKVPNFQYFINGFEGSGIKLQVGGSES